MYILHPVESPAQDGAMYKLTQMPRNLGQNAQNIVLIFVK